MNNLQKPKQFLFLILILICHAGHSQSNLDKILRGGEILIGGLSILKTAKEKDNTSKEIKSLCVRNKLLETITVKLNGKDDKGDEIKRELVIPKDGKECLLSVPKGIYTYEIVLSNKETFKKGEYLFEEEVLLTVKTE